MKIFFYLLIVCAILIEIGIRDLHMGLQKLTQCIYIETLKIAKCTRAYLSKAIYCNWYVYICFEFGNLRFARYWYIQ